MMNLNRAVSLLTFPLLLIAILVYTGNKFTKIEQTQEKLMYYSQALHDYTFFAICVIDRYGHVKIWSDKMEKIFGWSYDEVKGKDIKTFLIKKENIEKYTNNLEKELLNPQFGVIHKIVSTLPTKSGGSVNCEIRARLEIDENDKVVIIGIFTPIKNIVDLGDVRK